METQLFRLLWALPLVLTIGVGALLLLKRWGIGVMGEGLSDVHPKVLDTTQISEHTKVFTVQAQNQTYLVYESTAQIKVVTANERAGLAAQTMAARMSWGRRR